MPVYDFGEEDGQLYLVMRLMAGGSLAIRLAGGPLSPAAAAEILRQVAPGLDFAHRDLKPGNILFDEEGDAYLSDFGIAKMLAGDTESLTGTGALIGTPAYMSPEQVQALRELDGRSDVYSLGIIYYEMLAGRTPYQADTPMGTAMMHIMQPLPDIRAARSDLPPAAQQIIDRAMAKERERRYATAAALANAAAALVAEMTASVAPAPRSTELPIVAATSRLSEEMAAAAAAAVDAAPAAATGHSSDAAPFPAALPEATVVDTPPEMRAPTAAPVAAGEGWLRPPAWLIGCGLLLVCLVFAGLLGIVFRPQLAGVLEQIAGVEPSPTATRRPIATATRPPVAATATQPAADAPLDVPVCSDPLGCVRIEPGAPIVVAAMLVFSGPDAQLGQDSLHGVELAIAERRELHGHPLELMVKDEGYNPEGGQAAARDIVSEPRVVGVIGTSCSSAALAAAPIISEAGLTMISPSNTAPVLTQPDTHQPGYLRTAPNDIFQGRDMAAFAYNELGLRTAAVLLDGDLYGQGLADTFIANFTELGGQVVLIEPVGPAGEDAQMGLDKAVAAGPDMIFFPVFTEAGVAITLRARETVGLEEVTLAGSDAMASLEFLERTGEAAEGLYVSSLDLAAGGERYLALLEKYRVEYGEPLSVFHATAYDATMMLLDVIAAVAQPGPEGELLVGRAAVRKALFDTRDYEGASGRLTCTPAGDCAEQRYVVNLVRGGVLEPVWP